MDSKLLLSSDLLKKIRIDILAERLTPGSKITEQSLGEKYGVSRTPVREALRHLHSEGLIEMIPNRGAFVVGLSSDDVRDLFILRKLNEVQAVKWAIERRTDEEMEAIEESFDFMIFYTERGDAKHMRSINSGFHKLIAAASHNKLLIENLKRTQEYIKYNAKVKPYREESLAEILEEHRSIFNAFKKGDPKAGAAAMKLHVENSLLRAEL